MTEFLPDLTFSAIVILISVLVFKGKKRIVYALLMIFAHTSFGVVAETYSVYKFYQGSVTVGEALTATLSNRPAGNSLYPHNYEELVPHRDLESKRYEALVCSSQLTSEREYDFLNRPKDPTQIIMGLSKPYDSLTCCHSNSNFGVPYRQEGENLLLRCGNFPLAYIVKVNGSTYKDLTLRD